MMEETFKRPTIFLYAELVPFCKSEAAVRGWGSDAEGNYFEWSSEHLWKFVWGCWVDTIPIDITILEFAFDGTLDIIMQPKMDC